MPVLTLQQILVQISYNSDFWPSLFYELDPKARISLLPLPEMHHVTGFHVSL